MVALIAAIILSAGEIAKYALTRASLDRSNRSSVGTFVSLDLYLQNAEAVVGQGMARRDGHSTPIGGGIGDIWERMKGWFSGQF